jgi:hypothetical protein
MDPAVITALAYLISSAASTGLSIAEVLKKVEETGVIPPEEWEKFKTEFDDGLKFWAAVNSSE